MYKASCFGVSYLYNNETAETAIKYSLLRSHLHMAFPERDRWRAAAARKERVWGEKIPRLSLSSPAISLRKCHMEMTAEEATIKYFVPVSAFRIFNILLIINCKLPASTLFSFDSLYLSVIFYDKFLKRYRTFVKLFCCLNGFFKKSKYVKLC